MHDRRADADSGRSAGGDPAPRDAVALARALRLRRPLVVIDLEATGLDVGQDRIVEIGVWRVEPDGQVTSWVRRVNPERPIPAEAAAIHGINDAHVVGEATLAQLLPELRRHLGGADLAGYNVTRYDIPLLRAELDRVGGVDLLEGARCVDACTLFKRLEPRDLAAAYRRFVGDEQPPAHTARGDALAALRVLAGQLAAHPELPEGLEALSEWLSNRPPKA